MAALECGHLHFARMAGAGQSHEGRSMVATCLEWAVLGRKDILDRYAGVSISPELEWSERPIRLEITADWP